MRFDLIFCDEDGKERTEFAMLSYEEVAEKMAYYHKALLLLDCVHYQPCAGRSPLETIRFSRDRKGICSYFVRPIIK